MSRMPSESLLWSVVKVAAVPALLIAFFMIIWLRAGITSLEYEISELEKKKLAMAKEKKELLVIRSDLLSIKNIEHVAMERLGLSFPDRKKVVYVTRDELPFQRRADFGGR